MSGGDGLFEVDPAAVVKPEIAPSTSTVPSALRAGKGTRSTQAIIGRS